MQSIQISEDQWPIVVAVLNGSLPELSQDEALTRQVGRKVEAIRGRGEPYVVLLDLLRFRWQSDKRDTEPLLEKRGSEAADATEGGDTPGEHPLQILLREALGAVVITPSPWLRFSIRLAALVLRFSSRGPRVRFTAVETLQEGRDWAGEVLDGEGTSGGVGAAPIVPR